jgi:hypothetical protein
VNGLEMSQELNLCELVEINSENVTFNNKMFFFNKMLNEKK